MSPRGLAALATVMFALGGSVSAAGARSPAKPKPVAFGFAGVNVDQPVWPNAQIDLSHQFDVMVASGVDSIRAVIDWGATQPYANWSQVPADQLSQFVDVGGVPTNFTDIDALVALSAEHGTTLLPIVINAPPWDGKVFHESQVAVPRTPGPYAAFLKALVERYDRSGTFWSENPQIPKAPIEMWQIWNEPNVYSFWPVGPPPFYVGYVKLLRAAHAVIKQTDPTAKVVLAGLANFSWVDLKRIIKHGGRNLFDIAAIHPFTRLPQGVITILSYARAVLDRAGRKSTPMFADEISWPSSLGMGAVRVGFDFATTPAGQAARLRRLLPTLARDRDWLKLAGFYYYNWASQQRNGAEAFDFSGLFYLNGYDFIAKPAYYAYRNAVLAMERCRAKGSLATECLH